MGSLPTHHLIYEGERWPAWVEELDELVSAVSVEAARQSLPVSSGSESLLGLCAALQSGQTLALKGTYYTTSGVHSGQQSQSTATSWPRVCKEPPRPPGDVSLLRQGAGWRQKRNYDMVLVNWSGLTGPNVEGKVLKA
ncbi:unnamed protein product [Boreogadus saida]